MGRHGRSKNKQNSRGRGKSKFDVPEESSSSSEESASSPKTTGRGKIKGDVPEESASSSKTTGLGKVKGEHMQAVKAIGGLDKGKEEHMQAVKATGGLDKGKDEHMQAVKATGGLDKGKGKLPPDDDFNRALQQTRRNVINLRQESYEDIPVFPYGYGNKKTSPTDNKRAPPLWVTEIHDDQYIRDNLSEDWLPSWPTLEQIDNLYGQLNQYAFDVSSYSMVSSRVVNVAAKDELKGTEEIVLKGTPVTSVSDELIKEMYHIIRVKDTRECGGFLDFLRANSSGYIFAWRWLKDLSLAKTAVWCYFWDESKIIDHLKFLKFVPTKYRSAYSIVEMAKFGFDTMQLGIDALKHVYFNPGGAKSRGAELFFHIFLAFFGEGPRSDILKRIIKSSIRSESHEHSPRLGVMVQGLITNWGNVCRTASFLRLMILELQLAKDLIKEKPDPNDPLKPHPSLQKLFLQFAHHRRVAQSRCDSVVVHVKNIDEEYDLIKEVVDGKHIYGSLAYGKIVDNCLSLILHDEKLVCAIIMRDNGSDEMVGGLKDEVSLDEFWEKFDAVKKAYKNEPKDYILLRFLPECIPLLQRWKYARLVKNPLGFDEINTWCRRFITYTHSKPEAEAGDEAVKEWKRKRADVRLSLRQVVLFLESNHP